MPKPVSPERAERRRVEDYEDKPQRGHHRGRSVDLSSDHGRRGRRVERDHSPVDSSARRGRRPVERHISIDHQTGEISEESASSTTESPYEVEVVRNGRRTDIVLRRSESPPNRRARAVARHHEEEGVHPRRDRRRADASRSSSESPDTYSDPEIGRERRRIKEGHPEGVKRRVTTPDDSGHIIHRGRERSLSQEHIPIDDHEFNNRPEVKPKKPKPAKLDVEESREIPVRTRKPKNRKPISEESSTWNNSSESPDVREIKEPGKIKKDETGAPRRLPLVRKPESTVRPDFDPMVDIESDYDTDLVDSSTPTHSSESDEDNQSDTEVQPDKSKKSILDRIPVLKSIKTEVTRSRSQQPGDEEAQDPPRLSPRSPRSSVARSPKSSVTRALRKSAGESPKSSLKREPTDKALKTMYIVAESRPEDSDSELDISHEDSGSASGSSIKSDADIKSEKESRKAEEVKKVIKHIDLQDKQKVLYFKNKREAEAYIKAKAKEIQESKTGSIRGPLDSSKSNQGRPTMLTVKAKQNEDDGGVDVHKVVGVRYAKGGKIVGQEIDQHIEEFNEEYRPNPKKGDMGNLTLTPDQVMEIFKMQAQGAGAAGGPNPATQADPEKSKRIVALKYVGAGVGALVTTVVTSYLTYYFGTNESTSGST